VDGDPSTKAAWRTAIVAARRALPRQQSRTEAKALLSHVLAVARPGTTVCFYVPVGSEPGSADALDALLAANVRVLLPVAREVAGTPQPLAWGEYRTNSLVAAPFGLREPAAPWFEPNAIGTASIVLVPALAVDRTGARLGRGAGYYDRSLGLADPAAWLVAVVRDDELVDELPHENHDVPMTHALTPGRGLVALGRRAEKDQRC
jgi:5-formyltetrahydrofolate cyclo-ligase